MIHVQGADEGALGEQAEARAEEQARLVLWKHLRAWFQAVGGM